MPSSSRRARQFTAWRCCSHRVAHRRAESCPTVCLQGCDANHFCLEPKSQRSQEAVIEERQTEVQTGWWKTQSGWAGSVSGDDEQGREGMAHGSNLCFFFFPPPLFRPLLSVYLSDLFFFHIYSFSFSFVHCQFSSLSLFLCLSSYSMTRLFFFIQVRIIRCLFFILWMWENIWVRQFGDYLQSNDTFPLIPLLWEKHAPARAESRAAAIIWLIDWQSATIWIITDSFQVGFEAKICKTSLVPAS